MLREDTNELILNLVLNLVKQIDISPAPFASIERRLSSECGEKDWRCLYSRP